MARVETALVDADAEVREAAAWTLGQVGSLPPAEIPALAAALGDRDEVVRGLAAVALRNAGRVAAPARDGLVAALADTEDGVRMMAAQALGRLADPDLVDPLVAACRVPGQNVHVLRSLADALGELGPRAARALPVLRDLARMPRVAWSANAAIRKIAKTD